MLQYFPFMKPILSLRTFSLLLSVFCLFFQQGFSQIVGGHLNNEPTPQVAEKSTLNGGGFQGDVNLFNGSYSTGISLGTVSTPMGPSFTLQHSYSSSLPTGGVPLVCAGIPYGEGWQLSLPTITVEMDEFHKYSDAHENAENDPNSSYGELVYSQSDGWVEGENYWYNVTVSIPGVASGRAVFKQIDEKDKDCIVFALNKFEQPVEVRFYGSYWEVVAPNGDRYEFGTNTIPYDNASNRRIIPFEPLLDIVFSGTYDSYPGYKDAVLNVIQPKRSYSTWYCNRISNRNVSFQEIIFDYEAFGAFNYFKEFQQSLMPFAFHQILENTTFPYTHDYTSYRDVLLTRVTSYVSGAPHDIIDLNYETDFSVINSSGNRMINYTHEGSGRLDSLYSYKNLFHQGEGNATNFEDWTRFKHQSLVVNGSPSSSNPYADAGSGSYFRSSVADTGTISFDHSFLASPRITGHDLIPGDIYELRTKVKRNSTQSLINGNGLIDLKVVSGTRGFTQSNATTFSAPTDIGNNSISGSQFQKYFGIELFSTHNRAIKWSIRHGQASVNTSNYFVLPNIPSHFGGFTIQVGPSNSDHDFSQKSMLIDGSIPNAYNTYHHKLAQQPGTPRSASSLPHSFGAGMPWGMVLPVYQYIMTGGLLGQVNPQGGVEGSSIFNFWTRESNTPSDNVPTKFDENVRLADVELIRYSKNAYMLKSVKQYQLNGEYRGQMDASVLDTNYVLIAHKDFEYVSFLDDVFENYNYLNGEPILVSNHYKQVKVYLEQVKEMPVSDEFTVLPTLSASEIPTTTLKYMDFSTIPATYQDTLVLGTKTRVLTEVTDHLGGRTRITYYPLTHKATYKQHNYTYRWTGIADLGVQDRYGLSKSFTLFPAVHELIKWDEKELNMNNPAIAYHKKWTYVYDTENRRLAAISKPSTNISHFRYRSNSRQIYQGFPKTTVYSPADESGYRSYTEHSFYGQRKGEPIGLLDHLLIGKQRLARSYSHDGTLQSEKTTDYSYTRAFVNGKDRPNLIKDDVTALWVAGESEYRDWYKEDYYYYDAAGDTLYGYPAQAYISNTHLHGKGSYVKRPKFLEYHFYPEIRAINPEYFFHSYFVKKVREKERNYEDGLFRELTSIPEADPLPPIPANPVINDFVNDVLSNSTVARQHILTPDSTSKDFLLTTGKLCDTLLYRLVDGLKEKKWDENDVVQIMVNQHGLSKDVWSYIFTNRNYFTPSKLVRTLDLQPRITESLQLITLDWIEKRPSDEFLEIALTRENYLSDTVIRRIMTVPDFFPQGMLDSIFIRQPYLPANEFGNFLKHDGIHTSTKIKVASAMQMTNQTYRSALEFLKEPDLEQIVLGGNNNFPSDSILAEMVNSGYNPTTLTAIFNQSPRPFSPWLENIVKMKFDGTTWGEIILEPYYTTADLLLSHCDKPVVAKRLYIENVTEYSYYEANERGKTLCEGYKDLLGAQDIPGRQVTYQGVVTQTLDSIQLKHEPSWQVYSVKKYSPHLNGAFSQQKYYYYFDLLNRYDRWWFMYDNIRNGPQTINLTGVQDTINIPMTWHEEYTSGFLPQYEGMTKPIRNRVRTIPFQETTISKNRQDTHAIKRSTYYEYDARWNPDDFPTQRIITYEGDYCPPPPNDPCKRIYDCTDCYIYKWLVSDELEWRDLPYGYCSYTNTGGVTYHCPKTVDVSQWLEEGYVTHYCKDGYLDDGGSELGTKANIPQAALSNNLHLRATYVQIDTVDFEGTGAQYIQHGSSRLEQKDAFYTLKLDENNTDIAEFWLGGANEKDSNHYIPYRMILPKEALLTSRVVERNRYLMPTLIENAVGLQTRFYYDSSEALFYENINCPYNIDSYNSYTSSNIGLPYRVTVGYGREDSLSTTYKYSKAGLVKEMTSPGGKTLMYAFDYYNRLIKVFEEGRMLSENEYHYWDQNDNLGFEERAQMNYVLSTIYNDATSSEWSKAFVDPLGRGYAAISAVRGVNATYKQVHSGAEIYDNLGRVNRKYKPHLLESNTLNAVKNYNVAVQKNVYEDAPKSRTLRSYDYGVDDNSPHHVANHFLITDAFHAACELGLSRLEVNFLFGEEYANKEHFYRNEVTDQDGKQLVTYTNALGQKIATLQRLTPTEKITTLFAYDSYGNLSGTINARDQLTEYKYNMLGQLYQENSVDGGSKRYRYNKHGKVAGIQDDLGRLNKKGSFSQPYFRRFDYDAYGRLLDVLRVYYDTVYAPFLFEDRYIYNESGEPMQNANGHYEYLDYTFSNALTLDWTGTYGVFTWITGGGGYDNPGKRTTFGLPDGGYRFEKRFSFIEAPGHPSHGKLKGSQSYSSMDEPGVGTQYPIQEITYDYDALERLALEEIVFNPDGIGSSATPDLLSRIHYSDYNYRGSLLRRAVDVNQDNVIDLTYFYTYDNWNRMQSIHLALGNATDATGASKIVSYEYDDALGLLTQRNLFSQQGQTGNDTQINAVNYKYDVRDRMYNQSSELMFYRLYYDDQSVGTDSWGEPVAQSFNHNGTINGTRTVYNWDHTTMPSNAGMEGALLYGYQYDRLNRLLRADAIVEDYVTTQSGSNLYNCYGIGDVNVKYDPVGNIKQILRTLPETYAMGTLQLQHLNFAVGNTHNRVSQVTDPLAGLREFTYDVNGNLISDSKNGILQTDIGRSSYPYQLKGIHPATSESIQYTYLYDTDDSRIFKRVEEGSALQMEYYLKDIGIYDMISDKWTYFVQGDDRIAKVFPQNYQSPGQNAANTDLKVSQGMANFYEYDHLGNTRIVYSVRDIHNGTTSFDIHFAADYYPYGKTLRYFETAAFEEKFLTTQHERDRETGFDYRGARYYDSDLGRFLSLDPLAEKRYWLSPYNYVQNNPILRVDPDGMLDDIYTVDETGRVHLEEDTDDNYDVLYTQEDYESGEKKNGLTVYDQGILSGLSQTKDEYPNGHYSSSNNKYEIFKVFYFMANNTSKEWNIEGYNLGGKTQYTIATNHDTDKVWSTVITGKYDRFSKIFNIHSHPSIDGTKGGSDGDIGSVSRTYSMYKKHGMKYTDVWFKKDGKNSIFPRHYVYFKHNKTLYYYTPWNNSIPIRKTNKSTDLYRDLGF